MPREQQLNEPISRVVPISVPISDFLGESLLRQPSSVELGWRDFAVERRAIMPGERGEAESGQHFLILWGNQVAEGETAYRNGKFGTYRKNPNTLTAWLSGTRPGVRNWSIHEVVVGALRPEFLTGLQDELDHSLDGSLQDLYGTDDPDLKNILLLLVKEAEAGGPCGALYAESLTTALATRLLYAARLQDVPAKIEKAKLSARVLRRVLDRMQTDFGIQLNLETLAAESGYSRAHFLRMFKATTGQTPHRYLQELRLEKARGLIVSKSFPLADIAAICGFASHTHLTTVFRSKFGTAPSLYRRRK